MQIGKPQRRYVVEPIRDPVPAREQPAQPPKPEKVPAKPS